MLEEPPPLPTLRRAALQLLPSPSLLLLPSPCQRLSLAFGKRYSRALRGFPAVVKEARTVP